MQVSAQKGQARRPAESVVEDRRPRVRAVQVVAPGVCYILVEPRDIARVLDSHPGARIAPLARTAA